MVSYYVLLSTCYLPPKASASPKLLPLWIGPYRIVSVVNDNAYRLDLPSSFHRIHPVINVLQLKCYCRTIVPPPDPVVIDGLDEYEVAQILEH